MYRITPIILNKKKAIKLMINLFLIVQKKPNLFNII